MTTAVVVMVMATVEAVALVIVVWLLLKHMASVLARSECAERAWTAERRELLTRIQRPDLLPAPIGEPFVWPEDDDADDIGLVGTIADGPSDGSTGANR